MAGKRKKAKLIYCLLLIRFSRRKIPCGNFSLMETAWKGQVVETEIVNEGKREVRPWLGSATVDSHTILEKWVLCLPVLQMRRLRLIGLYGMIT